MGKAPSSGLSKDKQAICCLTSARFTRKRAWEGSGGDKPVPGLKLLNSSKSPNYTQPPPSSSWSLLGFMTHTHIRQLAPANASTNFSHMLTGKPVACPLTGQSAHESSNTYLQHDRKVILAGEHLIIPESHSHKHPAWLTHKTAPLHTVSILVTSQHQLAVLHSCVKVRYNEVSQSVSPFTTACHSATGTKINLEQSFSLTPNSEGKRTRKGGVQAYNMKLWYGGM